MTKEPTYYECLEEISDIANRRCWDYEFRAFLYSDETKYVYIDRFKINKYKIHYDKLMKTSFKDIAKMDWFINHHWSAEALCHTKSGDLMLLFRTYLDECMMEIIRKELPSEYAGFNISFSDNNEKNIKTYKI